MRRLGTRLDYAFGIEPLHERMLRAALLRDGRAGKRWRALRREIDLDTFWDGKALDFLPLVYRALTDEGVEDPDLPRLRGVHRRTWYANQLRFQRLAPALRALDAAGVEAMALKGVALAIDVYPDVGLRPMHDCDILVRPDRVETALAVLEGAGWRPKLPMPANHARRHQEIDVLNAEGEAIDLHWHIAQWLVGPGEEWTADEPFWHRSVPLDVAGAPARALDRTDSLVHALVHGARNGWRCAPQWVADAVLITGDGGDVEWDRVVDIALARNLALPMRRGLEYLWGRFEVPVPIDVLRRLDVPTSARSRRMFARTGKSHDPTVTEQRLLGPLASTYRFWVTESAPLDRRVAAAALPAWLADQWRVEGPWHLPAATVQRVLKRVRVRRRDAGDADPEELNTPPAP